MSDSDSHDRIGPSAGAGDAERRRGDRRSAHADRRFWRALTTERRAAERRQSLPIVDHATPQGPAVTPESPVPPAPEPDPEPDPVAPAVAAPDGEPVRASTRDEDDRASARRRARLKAMLDRAEARQRRTEQRRGERTRFAAGLSVRIAQGPHAGRRGTVIDADYIVARAMVLFADDGASDWVGFKDLIASVDETAG